MLSSVNQLQMQTKIETTVSMMTSHVKTGVQQTCKTSRSVSIPQTHIHCDRHNCGIRILTLTD
jgi:hypothetical protein